MAVNYYTDTREDTLDAAERELYDLIMAYRAENGLASIPLSKALTITAGRHAIDTVYNAGSFVGHSWSDRPYDAANAATYPNMWEAPARLGTGYTGNGFEISFGYSGNAVVTQTATPAQALAGWKSSVPHNNVILNRDIWLNIEFKGIGIGIHNGVAHVWFGDTTDASGAPAIEGAVAGLTIEGTPAADNLLGTDGDDTIFGFAGDDVINGGAGNDRIFGGDGVDTIYGGDGNDYIQGDGGAFSTLVGGAGNDTIYGGAGNDYMVGDAGDDVMVGMGGQDSLYGGAGNDLLIAGDGVGSVIDGGAGANSLWGGNGNDYMVGGEGADLIVGGAGSDYIFGNAGNDTLYGGRGTDYIYTNAGNDFVWTDDVGAPQSTDYIYVGGGTGIDTIADFTAGRGGDVLVVAAAATGLGTFAQAQAAMSQQGIYAVLDLRNGDSVYLYNVTQAQLTADNFIFL